MTEAEELELLELEAEEAAGREGPGGLESFARGAAQGATLGFADEIAGGARALYDVATGDPTLTDLPELYRQRRGESREAFRAAEEAEPGAFGAGQAGGALLTALVPGGAAVRGVGGALATGAALGAAQGLGESEADLTEGEFGEAMGDVGAGGLVGGALGGAGGVLAKGAGAVARRVGGRAQRGIAAAEGEEAAKQALKQAQAEASALGRYRSGVQSASRDLEVLGREAADLPDDALRRQAQDFLASPESVAVRKQVVAGKLGTGPERISEMQQLGSEYGALVSGREGLIKQATEAALADPFRRQFVPRLATLGHRLLPAALAGAGGILGGPEGAAAGAGLGGVMALTQGRPGIILRNLVRSPATRRALWSAVLRMVPSETRLGRWGAMLARAVAQGGDAEGEALHTTLLESEPAYADTLAALLDEQGAAEVEPGMEATQ